MGLFKSKREKCLEDIIKGISNNKEILELLRELKDKYGIEILLAVMKMLQPNLEDLRTEKNIEINIPPKTIITYWKQYGNVWKSIIKNPKDL